MRINPVDTVAVGIRIREIRQNLGLSMDDFASRIDEKAKSGTVSNWETGKNLPNKKRLNKIADLGGITVNKLLYGTMENVVVNIIEASFSFDIEDTSEEWSEILSQISRLFISYKRSFGNPYSLKSSDTFSDEGSQIRKQREENKENALFEIILEECEARGLKQHHQYEIANCIIEVLERLVFSQELNNEGFITEVSRLLWSIILNDMLEYYHQSQDNINQNLFDETYQLLKEAALEIDILKDKYVDEYGNNK